MSVDARLARFRDLVPTPPSPRWPDGSWTEVEAILGVRCAPDHVALLQAYGSGALGGELGFVDPRELGLFPAWAEVDLEGVRQLRAEPGTRCPLPAFPEPGPALWPVAANGSGDQLYAVVTHGIAADDQWWVGNTRDDDWFGCRSPLLSLLADVVEGSSDLLLSAEFSEDLWHLAPSWRPADF